MGPKDKNIRELQLIIDKDCYDKHVVRSMMIFIRKILEENSQKDIYPFLTLYCDWNVHTQLDQRPKCLTLLYNLTQVLVKLPFLNKWKEDADGGLAWNGSEALSAEVNKSLGIPELQKEMERLFTSENLPTNQIKDQTKWNIISYILLENLMETPIKFPDNIETIADTSEKKKIYNNIEKESKGNKENQVVKFTLVPRNQIPEEVFHSRYTDIGIFFQMETKSGHYFVGPFWVS